MKTIKQRAKEYADNYVVGDSAIIVELMHKVAEESYTNGAIEQNKIDIEKACEYLISHIFGHYPTRDKIVNDFNKVMEG